MCSSTGVKLLWRGRDLIDMMIERERRLIGMMDDLEKHRAGLRTESEKRMKEHEALMAGMLAGLRDRTGRIAGKR